MTQSIFIHKLENGLTLLAERMDWLKTAAISFSMPAGAVRDPAHRLGLANLTSELQQRGAGTRNSREFLEAWESLGAELSGGVSTQHARYGSIMPAENLLKTLPLLSDLIHQPQFPEAQLDEAKLVCLQELRSLEDDLAHTTLQRLKERHYPAPLGRRASGTVDHVMQATHQDVLDFYRQNTSPSEAVISVAGNFIWAELREQIEKHFGDWPAAEIAAIETSPPTFGYEHLANESNQTHLGLAYSSVPYKHPDYYQARAAVGVLSDGMSSRLFTEVRENRGLCYTVFASMNSLRESGSVVCYAGTTTERCQETLDVMLAELDRLGEGVAEDELRRLKVRLKSGLIMQQESSGSRAGSMASDWYYLGHVRTRETVMEQLESLSVESVNAFLADNPVEVSTIVTLGEQPLEHSLAIS